MADNLEIFGVEYLNVKGIKATNDDGVVLSFVRAEDGNSLEYGLTDSTSSLIGVGKIGSMTIE